MSEQTPSPAFYRRPRVWLIGIVVLLLLAAVAWKFWPAGAAHTDAAQQTSRRGNAAPGVGRGPGGMGGPGGGMFNAEPTPVRVAAVSQGDFPVYYKALGTVTALNTVSVRGRVDGELVKVAFEEGQKVKAGDLLAVIDPRTYQIALQQAEGTLAENQAQLKNAQIDVDRYRGLYAEDSIAKQTLDTQEALVNQYKGTLQGNQAAVNQAKLNLDFTQVRAPISGRLGLRQVDVGNLVSSGDTTALVTITQTQPISVAFTLPENELPTVVKRFRAGEKLRVEAWDRAETNLQAEGVLQSLDNQIDTTTGTLKFKARFGNDKETLFPNQFVNVRVLADTLQNVVLVPTPAVQFGNAGSFAYVMDGDDKVTIRNLKVGPNDGTNTVILEGLANGDRVVLEGTDRLREGSKVLVVHDANAVPTSPSEQLQGSPKAPAGANDAAAKEAR
jgi:multidrug efflux system membrane fusion protein